MFLPPRRLRNLRLQLRSDDSSMSLHPYEVNSIANLVDEETTVSQVLGWLPSMKRFAVDQIEVAINVVVETKARVVHDV